jgi:hypothetical protein
MSTDLVIVGVRVRDHTPDPPEGVVTGCCDCRSALWILAPSDLELLDRGAAALCRDCAVIAVVRAAGPTIFRSPKFDGLAEELRLLDDSSWYTDLPATLADALVEATRPN